MSANNKGRKTVAVMTAPEVDHSGLNNHCGYRFALPCSGKRVQEKTGVRVTLRRARPDNT